MSQQVDEDDWSEFVKLEHLTQQVTLDSFYAQDLLHHSQRRSPIHFEQIRQHIESHKNSLAARALPGDCWWEWVEGTERLMQSGGIALVRNGRIIYAYQSWIS
jgi:hypothetical protein